MNQSGEAEATQANQHATQEVTQEARPQVPPEANGLPVQEDGLNVPVTGQSTLATQTPT